MIVAAFVVAGIMIYMFFTMSKAHAESTATDRTEKNITAYYKADLQAEEILADLRNGVTPVSVKVYKATKSKGGVKRIVAENIGFTDWDAYATYSVPIDKEHELKVEVLLRYNKKKQYQILTWSENYLGDWNEKEKAGKKK